MDTAVGSGSALESDFDERLLEIDQTPGGFLGEGGFGRVYRGTYRSNGKSLDVAVKYCLFKGQRPKSFDREIALYRQIDSAFVVKYYGKSDDGETIKIVLDYMPLRSLEYQFREVKVFEKAKWSLRLRIASEVVSGLSYLHHGMGARRNIVHRDLKADNVLLDGQWHAKLGDLGISSLRESRTESANPERAVSRGTVGWAAPEQYRGEEVTRKSDMYSYGHLLWYLVFGGRGVAGALDLEESHRVDTLRSALKGLIPCNTLTVSGAYIAIFVACLSELSANRPESQEVEAQLKSLRDKDSEAHMLLPRARDDLALQEEEDESDQYTSSSFGLCSRGTGTTTLQAEAEEEMDSQTVVEHSLDAASFDESENESDVSAGTPMTRWESDSGEKRAQEQAKEQEKKQVVDRVDLDRKFLHAARLGDLEALKDLKSEGANVKAKDNSGYNALHLAALFSDSVDTVAWLLKSEASGGAGLGLEEKGFEGLTAFLCAAEKGKLQVLHYLKSEGANVKAKDNSGYNALHLAALFSDSVDTVAWLLKSEASGGAGFSLEEKGFQRLTAFLCAAEKGKLQVLHYLKSEGANVKAKDDDGRNALHLAALFSDSLETVAWLLKPEVSGGAGLSLEEKGFEGRTVFLCAAEKGKLQVLHYLKSEGANVKAKDDDGWNALHLAALISDSVETVAWLLSSEVSGGAGLSLEEKGLYGRTAFLCAARQGNLQVLRYLKSQGANIKAKDDKGWNALHLAALWSDSVETVAWLLKSEVLGGAGLSLEEKGLYGRTAFLCAAEKGKLQLLRYLKSEGANVKAKDDGGRNALHLAAAFSESVETVAWLFKSEASGGAGGAGLSLEEKGFQGRTAFLCAASQGKLQMLRYLKSEGANVKGKDDHGNNALHLAALISDSVETVAWLLTSEASGGAGLSLEEKGPYGRTAFLCAAEVGKLQALRYLQSQGANIKAKDDHGKNGLHLAAIASDSLEAVAWLLGPEASGGAGFSLEEKGLDGRTAFLCAAERGNLQVLHYLKSEGANFNTKDHYGYNALHLATLFSDTVETVAWLLSSEASGGAGLGLEQKDNYGRTAFFCAAEVGKLQALRYLQSQGANIKAKADNGNNALHWAALWSDSVETVAWLLSSEASGGAGLDLEEKGYYGRTAFLCAARQGNLQVLQYLKSQGANLKAKDNNKSNALALAEQFNRKETVEWLLTLKAFRRRKSSSFLGIGIFSRHRDQVSRSGSRNTFSVS